MRHRKRGRKFGRQTSQRRALRRHVVCALFTHGRIDTTLARAKDFRPYAERLITIAKRGAAARASGDQVTALTAYRRLLQELHDETVVAKLMGSIGPAFADRPGGYTRILRYATGRLGDNAPVALFELVDYSDDADEAPEAEESADEETVAESA
jgi:large subunit ribosomal protein L17